MASLKNKTW